MRAAWICGALFSVAGCGDTGHGKNSFAEARAKDLVAKVETFRLTHGKYPVSLDDLVRGDNPLLPPEAIRDPWDRSFRLELFKDGRGVERLVVYTFTPRGKVISATTAAE